MAHLLTHHLANKKISFLEKARAESQPLVLLHEALLNCPERLIETPPLNTSRATLIYSFHVETRDRQNNNHPEFRPRLYFPLTPAALEATNQLIRRELHLRAISDYDTFVTDFMQRVAHAARRKKPTTIETW